jgi:hypothetical protein
MSVDNRIVTALVVAAVAWTCGCSRSSTPVKMLRSYPVQSTNLVLSQTGVALDTEITADGDGALRITASEPRTVRLYETGDIDVENARLTYQARVRTKEFKGKAYLEMWCAFAGQGEFFSRDLATPVVDSTEWTTEETPFFLKKGQNPDNIKLNIVIDGTGTVWIDDIRLVTGPPR